MRHHCSSLTSKYSQWILYIPVEPLVEEMLDGDLLSYSLETVALLASILQLQLKDTRALQRRFTHAIRAFKVTAL